MLYYLFFVTSLVAPFLVALRFFLSYSQEKRAKEELVLLLFPKGEEQKEQLLGDMEVLTKGRYNRKQLLDYYLKIKGLQMVDLHTSADRPVRSYLMQPTKIRLNYFEQVQFYEKYLNYPQQTGMSAVENLI
ncbi:MAG: hypothetical protein HUJ96_00710 [Marinilabiliaceae bacterium]|nr:hypothetical protein [Marinilabiliaceae bacterium]